MPAATRALGTANPTTRDRTAPPTRGRARSAPASVIQRLHIYAKRPVSSGNASGTIENVAVAVPRQYGQSFFSRASISHR